MIPETIDAARLAGSIEEMGRIGETAAGGCERLTLTDLDRDARRLFVDWAEQAGCSVTVDEIGNVFARRAGSDPDRPAIAVGSHLDTQPNGGKFDGIYGVLAGLEVVRTLNDAGVRTEAPIDVVIWTNEEGARFPRSCTGSGVFSGELPLDEALDLRDDAGIRLGEELDRLGLAGPAAVGARSIGAFVEAHIEQGPILESADLPVGIVTAIQGYRWTEYEFLGAQAHVGAAPFELRRDALLGAARLIAAVRDLGAEEFTGSKTLVGRITVRPNFHGVVPEQAEVLVDLRHPDPRTLDALDEAIRARAAEIAAADRLDLDIREIFRHGTIDFDAGVLDTLRDGAARLGLPHREMISGAGHDAGYIAGVAPTAMVFVRCKDGISHSPAELATPHDMAAGCSLVLRSVLQLAGTDIEPQNATHH